MLHRPIDPETAIFRRSDFRYRAQRQRLLESRDVPSVKLRIAVDPAISLKSSADYSAIAVVAQVGASPELDVLDVWRGRLSARKLAERVKAEADRWARYSPVVVSESVAAQAWLAQALRDLGVAVREVRPQADKLNRAAPLGVRYENGHIYHDESLRDGEFEAELERFPLGANDDMVDAVVYACMDMTAPVFRVDVI
jgi:predicted phage terminase large subunit-like protein